MAEILCLDDDEKNLQHLKFFFESLGYHVMVGENGRQGVELFSNHYHFDLVITDINMPLLDGAHFAKYIRNSAKRDTPIVAITGSAGSLRERELFDDVLIKPVKLETLFDLVRSYVG